MVWNPVKEAYQEATNTSPLKTAEEKLNKASSQNFELNPLKEIDRVKDIVMPTWAQNNPLINPYGKYSGAENLGQYTPGSFGANQLAFILKELGMDKASGYAKGISNLETKYPGLVYLAPLLDKKKKPGDVPLPPGIDTSTESKEVMDFLNQSRNYWESQLLNSTKNILESTGAGQQAIEKQKLADLEQSGFTQGLMDQYIKEQMARSGALRSGATIGGQQNLAAAGLKQRSNIEAVAEADKYNMWKQSVEAMTSLEDKRIAMEQKFAEALSRGLDEAKQKEQLQNINMEFANFINQLDINAKQKQDYYNMLQGIGYGTAVVGTSAYMKYSDRNTQPSGQGVNSYQQAPVQSNTAYA